MGCNVEPEINIYNNIKSLIKYTHPSQDVSLLKT